MEREEILKKLRPVWAEIDLDAVAWNTKEIKQVIGSEVELMTVVKADGYGHGAIEVAKVALENGADRLAVALLKEGKKLREAGVNSPILILSPIHNEQISEIVEYNLTPTIFTLDVAEAISKYGAKIGEKIDIHIKVDTGMGRVGVLTKDSFEFIKRISKLTYINIEGVFSHLSSADETEGKKYTQQQLNEFKALLSKLKEAGIEIAIKHLANSAAIANYPESRFNLVRAGIITYGLWPSREVKKKINLKPVLELKANLVHIKDLPADYSISYGRTYITDSPTKIGTVLLGYGDGYPRLLSNKGEVLVKGKRAKILGRVCMDQFMIEITDIPDVNLDTEIILIGRDGEERITAMELASKIGTINYEIISQISSRITRIYFKNDELVKIKE
jgi:alanine racemase